MAPRNPSQYQLPHTCIPYLPPEIDTSDLNKNLCLLSDEELAVARARLSTMTDGRYSKNGTVLNSVRRLPFSQIVHEGELYILYRGRKHQKHAGVGDFGAVKYLQHASSKEWFAIKIMSERHDTFYHELINQSPDVLLTISEDEHEVLQKFGMAVGQLGSSKSRKKGLQYYIVMRVGPGYDLFNYMLARENKIHPQHFIDLLRKVVEAVDAMHRRGFIHRDVKPENFRFDLGSGKLTLLDFGLAKEIPDNGEIFDRNIYGASEKRAPEILEGQYSVATDIFAVGSTLADLLDILEMNEHEFDLPRLKAKELVCGGANETNFDNHTFEKLYDLCAAMMQYRKEDRVKLGDALNELTAIQQNMTNAMLSISVLNVEEHLLCTRADAQTRIKELSQHCHEVVMIASAGFAVTPDVIKLRHCLQAEGLKVYDIIFHEQHAEKVMDELRRVNPDAKWVHYVTIPPPAKYALEEVPAQVIRAPQSEFFKSEPAPSVAVHENKPGKKKCLIM